MSLAHDERLALVDTMVRVGPDAPTLCGSWTTRDLAAHLVLRERRPDAAAGILVKPLASYAERVQASLAARPYVDLLESVRTGPPLWSPMRPFDAQLNLGEMFVHHEDVRRAGPDWEPRELDSRWQSALWSLAGRTGRMSYRKAPCAVVLVAPDGRRVTVHKAPGVAVEVHGAAAELALHAFGRDAVRVTVEGPAEAVAAVNALDRGI
ncbi:TIGR03085 family protein [Rhodococcus spelaei]|uniref:TIGR03085 family protein n=1 Tax=Rhodococcus spelaei TaxID=2546320 RepID=A0A541AZ55_9NOCA|nr:TIGR03085 family metal-binding protein [Rhodococcus spelaei]TQF65343.1 TIGR03085 family protein [Rhodococcus spelaei]